MASGRYKMRKFFKNIWNVLAFIPRWIAARARAFTVKHKLKITTKATLIYAVIFTVIFAVAGIVIIVIYRNYVMHGWWELSHNDLVLQLILLTALIYPIAIALVLALGYYVIGWILKPVKKMTETAKTINTESLNTRMEGSGNGDEADALADILNSMLDSLQLAYEKQTRFVSDASHELRTPIAVVQGYSSLLKRWGIENKEVAQEAIDAIFSESGNMKNLVEKLLFLARTDKKNMLVKPSNFFLNELVEEVARETKVYEIEHEINIGQIEAVSADADRDLLKQVLRIILDNSIKYTPIGGKVTLSCYREEDELCALVVSDNGIGISEEDLPHIFERFYKCDKARVRDGGSTGLGLSIAKWILDNHNADITVSSSVGIGTTVKVLLPCNPPLTARKGNITAAGNFITQ